MRRQKLLLVDGHSMIFQRGDLSSRHARNRTAAREALVHQLNSLQDASDWKVAVVFDGTGPVPSEATEPGGIQVFYSASGQTADDLIERLAAKYSNLFDLTVATDDTLERTTVSSFGASSMSSHQLFAEMEIHSRELTERIRRLARTRK